MSHPPGSCNRRTLLKAALLAPSASLLGGCDGVQNPPALYVYFSQREIDLILVDYEPPPY